ncbi:MULTISPECIES: class I SAM-dependent methyltransferase [unclassified Shewanella]|uniref:class I SAM-dependent methyltransferase n=1 Tax=unclassified Shewanella TaxID=196818 RepID=UPI000C8175A1|nr:MULTISPECIES: class I SAM-dependent methyltransferase [unclassified Shewanella]MDO6617864.1 class I SAM-dependent methyltransferase [Shewanella sp. 6_MG-2023]MDO6639257.1 class I SAM-dependent methyltransferase [Shewanella sp. 5_MG-2023]MDO6677509.1 class I SAM-dependent methyltransferase [Shewanella sp. 4_MG-2023]MDO6774911.1 class I SAM-dependent methyltransferase [Shewanella sp. 3_MG-2023]PMG29415.1 SAM-dependent methyltransferase [Shewanella sp. 10N.286.52.C2]
MNSNDSNFPAVNALAQAQLGDDLCRLFHGRGGLFSGYEHICLDWFNPVLLLTSFKELPESERQSMVADIEAVWQQCHGDKPFNLVFQYRNAGQTITDVVAGEVPEKHIVTENGAHFLVHLLRGQNHGIFLDMANGRKWVKAHAKDKKVLNLFAYTCAFSVVALQGEATEVVNMDMSKGALAIGKQNHLLNDFASGARFLGHDIFRSWGKLTKLGPYDLIVADPPSNQKGSFVATKDYVRLLRRLPELLADNGEVLLCLNAPELGCDFLMKQVEETAESLTFVERIDNPPEFTDIDEQKSLKVLRYKL